MPTYLLASASAAIIRTTLWQIPCLMLHSHCILAWYRHQLRWIA